jgi:serine/threonine-protein kinase RsbW
MIMLTRTYAISLRQDMADLDRLQDFLQRIGQSLYLSRRCLLETNLVLEEIFSNFVSYGSNVDGDCSIRITFTTAGRGVDIRVEDTCEAFNPLNVRRPHRQQSVENCTPGGLGIHLIKNFTNDIRYERALHRNILIMKKEDCVQNVI